jgi:hypothetical protein
MISLRRCYLPWIALFLCEGLASQPPASPPVYSPSHYTPPPEDPGQGVPESRCPTGPEYEMIDEAIAAAEAYVAQHPEHAAALQQIRDARRHDRLFIQLKRRGAWITLPDRFGPGLREGWLPPRS